MIMCIVLFEDNFINVSYRTARLFVGLRSFGCITGKPCVYSELSSFVWMCMCTCMWACCAVLCCAVLCCAVLWCGVVWCAVVWCGVVCCAVEWCGVLWCAVVCCGVVCCGVLWCGVVCCGVVWCGVYRMLRLWELPSRRWLLVSCSTYVPVAPCEFEV